MKKLCVFFCLLACPLLFAGCVDEGKANDVGIKVISGLPNVDCPYTHKKMVRDEQAWQALSSEDACLQEAGSDQRFDQTFFENYALLVFTLPHSSGEKDLTYSASSIEDGTLTVTFDMRAPAELDTDVIKDLYCLRLPKDKLGSFSKITVCTWNLTLKVSGIRLSWEMES